MSPPTGRTTTGAARRRVRIEIAGTVQGVGFRPYVHGLATRLGLAGSVGNDTRGVVIDAEGPPSAVAEFLDALPREAPPLAAIEHLEAEDRPARGGTGFVIEASDPLGAVHTLVSPDLASCADCLAEIADPRDRRFRYPFTNCTHCGPRFTIVRSVPYDRARTTMSAFGLCGACAGEYADPADRRFHAQPVCCPDCGPTLALVAADGATLAGVDAGSDPIEAAARLIDGGGVLAVKGLGGYHLAADATDDAAVASLRSRKHREDKPFAVMVPGVDDAGVLCDVEALARDLLLSPARPIVLMPRRPDAPVAPSVAPGHRSLGVMLPYTPLHHLLLEACGRPLVMTSGNVSQEPIAYRDEDARSRLGGVADAFLTHDRPIHTRVDDSVVRVVAGTAVPVRRSRGYVPGPVPLGFDVGRPVLACGAELKNTFALARGRHAFVSHHIGDLENYETYRSYTDGIDHFGRLFEITPDVVAHDLHPEYLSTKHALDLANATGVDLVGVQHHHAHIASCLADNGATGPAIGVAFDGLGYGTDGTLWGGEFLVADLASFERVGHLDRLGLASAGTGLAVVERNAEHWEAVGSMARNAVNAPLTSSMGRLFDAVAAIVGLRDRVHYEGQAAVELEQAANPDESGSYSFDVDASGEGPFVLRVDGVIAGVVEDTRAGVEPGVVAARFHNAVVDVVVDACDRVRAATALSTVALSGGVFQNAWLAERARSRLTAGGFTVLTHRRVPPNDGGISLGQVAVAAHTAGGAR